MIFCQSRSDAPPKGPSVLQQSLNKVSAPLRRAMSEKISDAELVAKASVGDKEAYRVLVEKYQQRVFAIAFDVVRSREDAEDIAQESFVKAYLSLPEFKGESSFYTWLYRIAYNMAIDFRRRTVRRGGAPVEFDETRADVVAEAAGSVQNRFGSPQELMLRKEESQQIQKVLTEISPEHRAVITLREIEGLSYEEIADVVGVSKGTVMSRLHYARKHLQQGLQALGMRGSGKQALPEELSNIEQTTVSVKTT